MAMLLLTEDFKEFLKLLNDKEVEYLLVGGYAVAHYGYPRATADLDIWVRQSEANAIRLVSALREFGFDVDTLSPELFLEDDQIIRMGRPPMRIEILTSVSGVHFQECYGSKTLAIIDELPVSIISLEHLKRNKAASGRLKDLDDLDNLS